MKRNYPSLIAATVALCLAGSVSGQMSLKS